MLGCVALLASGANAQTVLYGNLSDHINGYTGIGPLYNSFSTGSAALLLTDVKVWVELTRSGTTGSFTVALYADNNTFPGTQLATIGSMNDTSIATSPGQVYDFPVSPGVALTPNTRYWIGMTQSGATATSTGWAFTGSTAGTGNIANEFSCDLEETSAETSTINRRSLRAHGGPEALTCNPNGTPDLMQVTASPSTTPPPAATVPTLSFTGVTVLGLLLAASAVLFLRRSGTIAS